MRSVCQKAGRGRTAPPPASSSICRPLPPRAQEYGLRAGLAVILALFVFATWNDLGHFGLFKWGASLRG